MGVRLSYGAGVVTEREHTSERKSADALLPDASVSPTKPETTDPNLLLPE